MNTGEENLHMNELGVIWGDVFRKVFEELPLIKDSWNLTVEATFNLAPWSNHPKLLLYNYLNSFKNTCAQMQWSIIQLKNYSNGESSNVTEFFVSHYFYDFVVRLKTATDLLALIINHVYSIGLDPTNCSLDKGALSTRLRQNNSFASGSKLAKIIDQTRENWLRLFDQIRDLLIHDQGVKFLVVGGKEHPIHIFIPFQGNIVGEVTVEVDPSNPLKSLQPYSDKTLLVRFLQSIGSSSVTDYLSIDPIILTDELWIQFREITVLISKYLSPVVVDFINNQT